MAQMENMKNNKNLSSMDHPSHVQSLQSEPAQATNDVIETTRRTLVKAVSWQTLGIIVMTLLGFVHTGSITSALSLASSSFVISTVAYVFHEKFWQRVSWGKVRRMGQI